MQAKRVAKVISLSLPPDMFARITDYCAERGCSRSWFMNKAAELYLNECLEDKADYEAAVSAWNDFEKDGCKSASAASVFEKAGV